MRKKYIFSFLLLAFISIILLGDPIESKAATYYPGTYIEAKPGDIIYSPKSIGTFYAGHVAIVSHDLNVYHSYNDSDGKRADSISYYINELFKDEDVLIRRYNGSENIDLENVGGMATSVWNNIERYAFNSELSNMSDNYCSKFVWQAFHFATGLDILNKGYSYYNDYTYILPDEFRDTSEFITIRTYNR